MVLRLGLQVEYYIIKPGKWKDQQTMMVDDGSAGLPPDRDAGYLKQQ